MYKALLLVSNCTRYIGMLQVRGQSLCGKKTCLADVRHCPPIPFLPPPLRSRVFGGGSFRPTGFGGGEEEKVKVFRKSRPGTMKGLDKGPPYCFPPLYCWHFACFRGTWYKSRETLNRYFNFPRKKAVQNNSGRMLLSLIRKRTRGTESPNRKTNCSLEFWRSRKYLTKNFPFPEKKEMNFFKKSRERTTEGN